MKTSPSTGRPVGPGIAVLDRVLDRAHARPPGGKMKVMIEMKTIMHRKGVKVSVVGVSCGMKRVVCEDIFCPSVLFLCV